MESQPVRADPGQRKEDLKEARPRNRQRATDPGTDGGVLPQPELSHSCGASVVLTEGRRWPQSPAHMLDTQLLGIIERKLSSLLVGLDYACSSLWRDWLAWNLERMGLWKEPWAGICE